MLRHIHTRLGITAELGAEVLHAGFRLVGLAHQTSVEEKIIRHVSTFLVVLRVHTHSPAQRAMACLVLRRTMTTLPRYAFKTLSVTQPKDHVLHVALNRPDKRNAMNMLMWQYGGIP